MPGVPPICSVRGRSLRTPSTQPLQEGYARAAIHRDSKEILWPSEKKPIRLKVAFLSDTKKYYLQQWGLNEATILEWANRWNFGQIPSFELCLEEKRADIVVELNGDGRNYSKIGRTASTCNGEATMWLGLSKEKPEYNEHLVVHEFGHALGLEHEHQRSDFWKKIEPYIDTDKMNADPDLQGRYNEYKPEFDPSTSTDYDPKSVMHYWFKCEWLKEDYNSEEKVNRQRKLYAISESEMKALLGVHMQDCQNGLMKEPSEYDLKFLNELYTHGSFSLPQRPGAPQRTPYDVNDYNQGDLFDKTVARDKIIGLQIQYENLRKRLYRLFNGKNEIMSSIRLTIASCISLRPRYKKLVDELKNVEDFYVILTGSLSYLDFDGLLDELIYQYGDEELKEDAESYRIDLLTFLGHTTIQQAAQATPPWWSAEHDHHHLTEFSEVRTRVLEDPATFRLIELISLRMTFTGEIGLPRLIFLVLGIKELNSFMVSWLIPSALIPILADAVKSEKFNVISVFQTYKISLLSVVTEKILYPVELESSTLKSALPTTKEAASYSTSVGSTQHDYGDLEKQFKKLQFESRTKKHHEFVSGSMEEMTLKQIPGIGDKLSERLSEAGFSRAKDILCKYLEFDNEAKFKEWLHNNFKANAQRQKQCCKALKEWCDKHI